ncbi:MAG: 2-amino-4-hydroxy-6-hydroxymethyldihydropteridine diphosphokinase [Treponema sp.]|nr:2-amino-4-hydroxy-6-hydroxymethyldihydropteridine diphosphokinase [Treponema sp.]
MSFSNVIPVLLGLGSNKSFAGHAPAVVLAGACAAIQKLLTAPVFSSIYRTKPLYVTAQDDFFNMAVYGTVPAAMTPHELLTHMQKIEAQFGRNRAEEIRFGPRSLDIDIETFGDLTVNEADLIIPHPRLAERAFVLVPALEIIPHTAHEKNRERYAAALAQLADHGVEYYAPPPC